MFELYSLSKNKGIISLLRNLFSKNKKDDIDLSLFSAPLKELKRIDLNEVLNDDKILIDNNTNLDDSSDILQSDYMFKKIIKCLTEIEEIKELIDMDEDGEINEDELSGFIEEISANDGDDENFSMEDISKVFDDNDIDSNKVLKDLDKSIKEEIKNKQTEEAQANSGRTGGGGGSFGGGGGIGQTPNGENENGGKNYANLSLEELEAEKATNQEELTKGKETLAQINNFETETLKAAKEEEQLAKEEYDKLLENDMEANPVLKELNNQKETNEKNIQENEVKIAEAEMDLLQKDIENTNQESVVAGLKSELSSLESSLSALQGQKANADKDKQAEIDAKISSVTQQIAQKKTELQEAEQKLNETKQALTDANNKLEELNTQKTTLDEEKNQIEAKIQESCSEATAKAMENYNKTKDALNALKAKETEAALGKVVESQNAITEINTAITEKKIVETRQENGVFSGEKAADFGWSLKGSSEQQFANAVYDKYNKFQKDWKDQCHYHKGLYCGDFVYFCHLVASGKNGLPNWYRNCENVYFPPTVDKAAREAGAAIQINGPQDINKVKPGDIITFKGNADGSGAHIGMVKSIDSNGVITTIEGNTYPNGSVNSRQIRYDDPHIAQLSSMNL